MCPHHAQLAWSPAFGDFVVLCRGDSEECTVCSGTGGKPWKCFPCNATGRVKGRFELATRRSFRSMHEAFQYAEGILASREPFVALVFSPDRKKP